MQLKMFHLLIWCFHDFMMSTAFVTVTPRLSDIWTAVGNFDEEVEDMSHTRWIALRGMYSVSTAFYSF